MNLMPESLTESDLQNIHELQPDGWPEILPSIEFYFNSPFCYPIKISIDGRIAGIGTGITFGSTAWLAHIIVIPEFRNSGIAGLIVRYLYEFLENSGCITISLLATALGYPVYKKAGFTEQAEYLFFERNETMKDYVQPGNIIPFNDDCLNDILSLDMKVSGEDRRRLLAEKLKSSYVCIQNNKAAGYYIPDLGEGLIIADTEEAGIELMKLRYSKRNYGVIPADNRAGVAFLRKNGFRETKRCLRMISGKEFSWCPEKVYNRIAGNLG